MSQEKSEFTIATQRRALITRASSGIGKATALAFAKAGIDIALVSRSQEKLEAVASAAQMLTPEIVAQSILYTALLPKQAVIDELTLMPSAGVL